MTHSDDIPIIDDDSPSECEDEHVCETCGNELTRDAWPSTEWFCERCDDHIDPGKPE